MEEEDKCYKSFGGPDVNLACLDFTNPALIEPYCGNTSEGRIIPEYTSQICPQHAQSKISYHQCYNSVATRTEQG